MKQNKKKLSEREVEFT